jgi:outer membrane protein
MKSLLTAIFAFVVFPAVSFSQEKDYWTLDRCINYALENNIQIKRQELNSDISRLDYTQAYFNFTPTLNAGVEHSISTGRALNTELYLWENKQQTFGTMGVRSEISLFKGFQNINLLAERRYSFLSSREDLEKTKNDISLQIVNYYLQVLFDQELLEVAQSQYELTILQVEKTKKMVEVGNVAMGQLYEIQAQSASEKLNLTVQKNKLQLSVLDLVQLLDLDTIGNFSVISPEGLSVESTMVPASLDEVVENAMMNLPEIKGAEYRVKGSEKDLWVQRAGRSPELYLNGVYYSRYQNGSFNPNDSTFTYPMIDQLRDKQYSQITLGLSIPVFNRYQTQTAISKAKINLADSRYQLEQKKQLLYKAIQQAYTDALGAFEKYKAASEAVKSNEEAFGYTRQKFEVGLVNAVDFSIARNNYTKAMSDLAQAKYEYIFKVKILDFFSGKPVVL